MGGERLNMMAAEGSGGVLFEVWGLGLVWVLFWVFVWVGLGFSLGLVWV